MKDLVIVGKGPAGISAAIYAKRAGMDVTVIAKGFGAVGTDHLVNNFYGFPQPIAGIDLINNGIKQAENLGVEVISDEVVKIAYTGNYEIEGLTTKLATRAVVLATGSSRMTPNIAGIQDFEGRGVSYCAVCDAFFYRGKDVVVIGAGEFAVKEANELVNVVNSVTILTNGKKLETKCDARIKVDEKPIAAIVGNDRVEKVVFKDDTELMTSGVFVALGVAGSSAFALTLGALVNDGKIVVNDKMETNIPGLFAAGDCIGGVYQIYKAVYDGSIAGTTAAKYVRKLKA